MSAVQEIADVLARHREFVTTNTPLEVLAKHMLLSLGAFEIALKERADHQFYHPERKCDGR